MSSIKFSTLTPKFKKEFADLRDGFGFGDPTSSDHSRDIKAKAAFKKRLIQKGASETEATSLTAKALEAYRKPFSEKKPINHRDTVQETHPKPLRERKKKNKQSLLTKFRCYIAKKKAARATKSTPTLATRTRQRSLSKRRAARISKSLEDPAPRKSTLEVLPSHKPNATDLAHKDTEEDTKLKDIIWKKIENSKAYIGKSAKHESPERYALRAGTYGILQQILDWHNSPKEFKKSAAAIKPEEPKTISATKELLISRTKPAKAELKNFAVLLELQLTLLPTKLRESANTFIANFKKTS